MSNITESFTDNSMENIRHIWDTFTWLTKEEQENLTKLTKKLNLDMGK